MLPLSTVLNVSITAFAHRICEELVPSAQPVLLLTVMSLHEAAFIAVL
jgi:hypothetical protein